ncbi:hypothetical protein D5F01_LYC13235 [Larimichthys crocea]|uniref:Uncharacterized protein n=1 Tax=Larimichthys crocea TaxID=215358 RepID=A0A6G0IDS1_LARCR|nr:hypothetical protein D5F01_LYC13235 [Larimichthys crocea]
MEQEAGDRTAGLESSCSLGTEDRSGRSPESGSDDGTDLEASGESRTPLEAGGERETPQDAGSKVRTIVEAEGQDWRLKVRTGGQRSGLEGSTENRTPLEASNKGSTPMEAGGEVRTTVKAKGRTPLKVGGEVNTTLEAKGQDWRPKVRTGGQAGLWSRKLVTGLLGSSPAAAWGLKTDLEVSSLARVQTSVLKTNLESGSDDGTDLEASGESRTPLEAGGERETPQDAGSKVRTIVEAEGQDWRLKVRTGGRRSGPEAEAAAWGLKSEEAISKSSTLLVVSDKTRTPKTASGEIRTTVEAKGQDWRPAAGVWSRKLVTGLLGSSPAAAWGLKTDLEVSSLARVQTSVLKTNLESGSDDGTDLEASGESRTPLEAGGERETPQDAGSEVRTIVEAEGQDWRLKVRTGGRRSGLEAEGQDRRPKVRTGGQHRKQDPSRGQQQCSTPMEAGGEVRTTVKAKVQDWRPKVRTGGQRLEYGAGSR